MAGRELRLTRDENISIAESVIRRLMEGGSGDAALLYLALSRRSVPESEKLRGELRWDERRFAEAQNALIAMGLVAEPEQPPAPRSQSVPEYSREDVMGKLESDGSFAALLGEVERKLGRLSDPSVKKLLGIYDFLGLPADVIFLLVNYCIDRKQRQFGEGRNPTMREVEKEAYAWARLELFSTAAADAYIRREKQKRRRFPAYMDALQLGGREPAPAEERYLGTWSDMGFPPETVALAYDKTMLKCHELKWPYLNGILKRWHEKGIHSPDQARAENSAPRDSGPPQSRNDWMKDYD